MRFYVVPKVGDGISIATAFRPKYTALNELGAGWNVGPFQAMDYGLENVYLLAVDLDASQHATLSAQADVLSVPSPITTTVTAGALNTVKTKLEAGNVPADWVTVGMTYQQVLSRVIRIVQFMQRFDRLFGRLFAGGMTLDTSINQIPAGARNNLRDAALSLGAITSGITGTTLVREGLVLVADQLFTEGIVFGGVTL
jgi:hypothetical protein